MLSSMYVQVAVAIDNEKLKRKLNRLQEKRYGRMPLFPILERS